MRIFEPIDPLSLQRRKWRLWLLALGVIFFVALGTALLTSPSVLSDPIVASVVTLRRTFFGLCAISVFLLGFLTDREIVIGQLRKRLAEEQKMTMRVRREASTDLLGTLPGFKHFQDQLAMEYRRAAATQQPLSLVLVVLKSARNPSETTALSTAFGNAAKVLIRKLRDEDSIYHFRGGVFCILLPGVETSDVSRVANRLTEGLKDALTPGSHFSFEVRTVNYPEHAASAWQIEEIVRAFLPERPLWQHEEEMGVASKASR